MPYFLLVVVIFQFITEEKFLRIPKLVRKHNFQGHFHDFSLLGLPPVMSSACACIAPKARLSWVRRIPPLEAIPDNTIL